MLPSTSQRAARAVHPNNRGRQATHSATSGPFINADEKGTTHESYHRPGC